MHISQETAVSPEIFVFCALSCEARPLIAAWRLKKLPMPGLPFVIYADQTRVLVISGIGKIAMAGAVGYVLAFFADRHPYPLLINLGVAGHQSRPLGAVFLAHKIVDAETSRRFFPQLPFVIPCATLPLATYSRPQTNYSGDNLYDMEAAGFYEMAVKFSSSELIHVVKIISDNAQSPLDNINESLVEGCIAGQLREIESVLGSLAALQRAMCFIPMLPLFKQLLEQFHFTVTSSIKLKGLLARWAIVRNNEDLDWAVANLSSSKQWISWLTQQLDNTEFRL